MYKNAHRNFIYNSLKQETIFLSTEQWILKVCYIHIIPYSNKKKKNQHCNTDKHNTGESQKCYNQENKPHTKYCVIYLKSKYKYN